MQTKEDFKSYVNSIEQKNNYQKPQAFALGMMRTKNDKVLDVYFPHVNWDTAFGTAAIYADTLNLEFGVNKEYKITIEQLNDVYQKFIAFHDEIDVHPNIKVIKNFIDNYSHKHP